MSKKCWGCNKYNVSILAWLGGDNICKECKGQSSNPNFDENYKCNSKEYADWLKDRIEKNNNMFGIRTPEQNAEASRNTYQPTTNTISRQTNSLDTFKLVCGIGLILFVLWMLFGGLLEDQSSYNTQNTRSIDCSEPGWENSPYCNSEYDNKIQGQDSKESTYYQNIVR